jgi:hypothetical protein
MSAVLRSPEWFVAPTDGHPAGDNKRRVDEAFRLLGLIAGRIVLNPNASAYVLDLASQQGELQDVWCRDGLTAGPVLEIPSADPAAISGGTYGAVNAERYVRAQKALSALLLELARPNYTGSATLRLRGTAGEIGDDLRGESRRQWPF